MGRWKPATTSRCTSVCFLTGFDCCCVLLFPCGTPLRLINRRMVVGTCCFGSTCGELPKPSARCTRHAAACARCRRSVPLPHTIVGPPATPRRYIHARAADSLCSPDSHVLPFFPLVCRYMRALLTPYSSEGLDPAWLEPAPKQVSAGARAACAVAARVYVAWVCRGEAPHLDPAGMQLSSRAWLFDRIQAGERWSPKGLTQRVAPTSRFCAVPPGSGAPVLQQLSCARQQSPRRLRRR